jgi:allantoinase
MKTGEDAMAIWGGIAGVQSTLPALLGQPGLAPAKVAELTAIHVAERFRLPDKGRIAVGFDADFALVDLSRPHVLEVDELLDRHKLSPYVGRKFAGTINRTIARGKTIFHEGRARPGRKARLLKPSEERAHA